jgi:hypothetical protein
MRQAATSSSGVTAIVPFLCMASLTGRVDGNSDESVLGSSRAPEVTDWLVRSEPTRAGERRTPARQSSSGLDPFVPALDTNIPALTETRHAQTPTGTALRGNTHRMNAGDTGGPRDIEDHASRGGVPKHRRRRQADAMGARDPRRRKRKSHLGRDRQRAASNQGSDGLHKGGSTRSSRIQSYAESTGSDRVSQHLSTIRAHASVPVSSPSRRAPNNAHECTGCDLLVREKDSTLHIE